MKKLLTKSLSAILCLLLAVSVFAAIPVTADAAAVNVTALSVTIDEPVIGQTPSFSAGYPAEASAWTNWTTYNRVNGINWYDVTDKVYLKNDVDTFKANHSYRVSIMVQANDGYKFSSFIQKSDVKINGNAVTSLATPQGQSNNYVLDLNYTFPAIEPEKYNIYLAGIQLNELNKDTVAEELALRSAEAMESYNSGKMKISYDPEENILYLKDAIIDTADVTAQGATFGEEDLTVVLEGGNKIYGRAVNGIKLTESATITGSGYLSVYGKNDAVSYQKGEHYITTLAIKNTSVNFSGSDGIMGKADSNDYLSIIFSDVDIECENEGMNYLGLINLKDCYIAYPYDAAIKFTGNYCGVYSEGAVAKSFIIRQSGMLGDINFDGAVDVLDAAMIQKYNVGKIELDYMQLTLADVNGDGEVDILDAAMIQKYTVGKIDFFPGGKG